MVRFPKATGEEIFLSKKITTEIRAGAEPLLTLPPPDVPPQTAKSLLCVEKLLL